MPFRAMRAALMITETLSLRPTVLALQVNDTLLDAVRQLAPNRVLVNDIIALVSTRSEA